VSSVYKNSVDAYQRAFDIYQRRANAFNNSFYRDAQGNQAGLVNGVATSNTPSDISGYSYYADPTNPNNKFLRKPTGSVAETAQLANQGRATRGITLPNGEVVSFASNKPSVADNALLQRGYLAPNIGFDKPNGPLQLQKAQFTDAPSEFRQTAPTATYGQLRQMGQPTMAQQEAGLISEVLGSRGLRPNPQIKRADPARAAAQAAADARLAASAQIRADKIDGVSRSNGSVASATAPDPNDPNAVWL